MNNKIYILPLDLDVGGTNCALFRLIFNNGRCCDIIVLLESCNKHTNDAPLIDAYTYFFSLVIISNNCKEICLLLFILLKLYNNNNNKLIIDNKYTSY